jgi:DnaJ-class molecular chaperone
MRDEYDRLVLCSVCEGSGSYWDVHVGDFTVDCLNCNGVGTICGECLQDVDTCPGEGICWEQ